MASASARGPSKGTSRAWEALTPPLAEWILGAISSMGFEKMTPVQASTIPLFMGNKDVVVEAVTGSGKTLSYLLPLVQRILRAEETTKKHHVAGIVVSPTRELATQIHTVLQSLLAFHAPSAAASKPPDDDAADAGVDDGLPRYVPCAEPRVIPQLLLGGATTPAHDLAVFLRTSPNLLIATPGRLNELLASPHVHVPQSSFDALVLDEADRLLDLGFSDDLGKILRRLPKQRRTGLFSASVSEAVDQLIRVGLRNPVRVSVKVKGASGALDQRTPASLAMTYMVTPAHHKLPALAKLINAVQPSPQKAIVYLSTCAAVDYFQHILPPLLASLPGPPILVPLHGKHPPNVRSKNFTRFTNAVTPAILLTTDLAARGLDIPSVDVVVQVDPPSDPKVFLHRCGRAGRAGRRGLAIVMLTPGREEDYIPFLSVRKTPVVSLAESGAAGVSPDLSINEDDADKATSMMRDTVKADRAIHDKAQRAFVSWVRSYSKHVAASIFRIKEVNWDELARGWGLLRMPRMPELKASGWKGDPLLVPGFDWEGYAYKDKIREQRRREERESAIDREGAEPRGEGKRKVPEAWSEKREQKETREVRREKRHKKRDRQIEAKMSDVQRSDKRALDVMISKVRQQNLASPATAGDDFDGFSD